MPKNNKSFNKELEGFLRACGFGKVVYMDTDGEAVPDAGEADQFKFNYKSGSHDHGTVTITTHDGRVTVYYNQSAVRDADGNMDPNWTKFLKKLKDWSLRYGQMGFSVKNIDKLGSEMKNRKSQKREEQLLEGYYGNRHTSYSDNTPSIKMIIKHNKSLDEGDQRYHHIEKIFLENSDGERILVPSRKPSVGRAFARHLAEGGQYNDDRWNHIKEIAEDISKLSGFVRATRGGQFNESVGQIVQEATNHYQLMRETIKRISGSRGYNSYFENWQPTLMEEEGGDYSTMFVSNTIDPRIERALPVLGKLKISVKEMQEAVEFGDWADSIVEAITPESSKKIDDLVELLQDEELPVGADAMSIKGQLDNIISNEIEKRSLFAELDELAASDPDNDAKPTIIGWLQKHRGEDFYDKVLDRVGEQPIGAGDQVAGQPEQPPPVKQEPAPQPAQNAAKPTPKDVEGVKDLMPPPMAEELEEADSSTKQVPLDRLVRAVESLLGTRGAARFAAFLRPGTAKMVSWDSANKALMAQGVKPHHIAAILTRLRPAELDESITDGDLYRIMKLSGISKI